MQNKIKREKKKPKTKYLRRNNNIKRKWKIV